MSRLDTKDEVQQRGARSIDATARYFDVSRSTNYRLIRSGELACTRIGSRTVVRHVDAEAFLSKAALRTASSVLG